MRSLCLKLGMLLGAALGLLWWTDLGSPGAEAASSWVGLGEAAETGPPPVIVMQLGSRAALAQVRAELDPERIVAETPDAIALREGFVLATGFEGASAAVNAAGFAEREIELFSPREREEPPARAAADLDRLAKPGALSPGEALAAMHALHAGY